MAARSGIVNAKWLVVPLVLAATPVLAQQVISTVPAPAVSSQARFQIRVMEGVLETAVQNGALIVSSQIRQVSPDLTFFSGPARARGFRVEEYGVFFAVDVPALHRSLTWSLRTVTQSNADLTRALESIRRAVLAQNDARMKGELEQALKLVELQVGPPAMRRVTTPDASRTGQAEASPPAGEEPARARVPDLLLKDPGAAYTKAVQDALIDAMVDYGSTLSLDDSEWLTVAAREMGDAMMGNDLGQSVTITLRARGTDLSAFKAGRLTREEMKKKVEAREF
jgi:hypothetical protein